MRSAVDVLVISDEETLGATYAEILDRWGYSVKLAENFEVASRLLEHLDVALILLAPSTDSVGEAELSGEVGNVPANAGDFPPVLVLCDSPVVAADVGHAHPNVVQLPRSVQIHDLMKVIAGTLRRS